MTVEIGTEAAQFPEMEYINGIFVAVWSPDRRSRMGTRRCPLPACHLQGVTQPVFSIIQNSFSGFLRGADVIQNKRKISQDEYFINSVFSTFALMVSNFLLPCCWKKSSINNSFSWPWKSLLKSTFAMYENIFSCVKGRVQTGKINQLKRRDVSFRIPNT
jgi:hypothetical protein